jgi:hypothetical protein
VSVNPGAGVKRRLKTMVNVLFFNSLCYSCCSAGRERDERKRERRGSGRKLSETL